MNFKSVFLIPFAFIFSCTNLTDSSNSKELTKLTSDEIVERARNGVFPDPTRVSYLLETGDTISYDSLLVLEKKSPMVLDDYVNADGIVVMAVVRNFTDKDIPLRLRIQSAYNEFRLGGLDGRVRTEIIKSTFLKEDRYLDLYLPQTITEYTPIIYAMDGGYFDETLKTIDTLISTNIITPIIMVGVPSSIEHRFREYVFNQETAEHFNHHMSFFTKEVIEHIEKNVLKLTVEKANRYISGNSNGGDFSIVCALENPHLFNESISFSGVALGSNLDRIDVKTQDKTTSFYIGVGSKELSEFETTNRLTVSTLKKHGFNVEYIQYDSGHDFHMWKTQFIEYLKKRFSK